MLGSQDTRVAFERALVNVDSAPFPTDLPRYLPRHNLDGTPLLDSKGLALLISQMGTGDVENFFGRAERALSAHGGYNIDYATLLGHEFLSASNAAARRSHCGEPDLQHNKLSLIGDINRNYQSIGESKYCDWYKEPEQDDGRRYFGDYFGDYFKSQHPTDFDA
ncbi:MAG: hypothetical protein AAF663_12845, partial [Planctomycetota bacterium]